MQKKKTAALALFGLALAIWGISRFVRLPFFDVHPHAAIPSHTALFFVLEKSQLQAIANDAAPDVFSEVFLPKNMREELISHEAVFGELFPFPSEKKIYVTVNPTRDSGIDLLFIMPGYQGAEVENTLQKEEESRVRKSIFQNQEVFTVGLDGETFSFARYRNLLLAARHAYLVENAIGQLKSPATSICRNGGFKKLKAKNEGGDIYDTYLNIKELGAQFAPLIEPSELGGIKNMATVGPWLRLNFFPKNKKAKWSATFAPNESHPLLRANQSAPKKAASEAFPFLPDDLTAFTWLSQKSFSPAANNEVWETYFAPWAGHSTLLALGEKLGGQPTEKFLLLHASDPKLAEVSLEKLAGKMLRDSAFEVQMFKVWPVASNAISEMFGLGHFLENPYVATLGEYVLFGNSRAGMERWLVKYMAGQTLASRTDFLETASLFAPESQLFFYLESADGWQVAQQFLKEKRGMFFNRNPFIFNHLVGSGNWKSSTIHLAMATQSGSKKADASAGILWRLPLAGRAVGQPFISQNPRSGEKEILVRDDRQTIYLISNTGRLIWQRTMDEDISSGFAKIDLKNDGRRQFVFSTRSAIHVLEDDGSDMAGYPLRLQVPATNGVTVVDFFQSHDYSFFIACENGNAYGFDERGSPLEGWRPKTGVGQVRHPLLHFQAMGMDFLALLTKEGEMQVFQKNGNYRFPKVELFSASLQVPDYQAHKLSSRIVTSDDEGRVYVINFKGDHFRLHLKTGKNEGVKFTFSDVVGDSRKDYVALSGADLAVHFYRKNNFEKAWAYQFPMEVDEVFPVKKRRRGKAKIGTVSRTKKRIFLLGKNGELEPNFPLEGTTPFIVENILGNGREVVVTGNGRSVCAYSLE